MRSALLLLFLASPAGAEQEFVLKLATIAPDGTLWARNLRAFARKVEQASEQRLHIKWYFGGVAGDEAEQLERIQRGQLDGGIQSVTCDRISPSIRIMRLSPVFQTRAEANYAMNLLQPTFEGEARQAGFVMLSSSGLGPDLLFTRTPVSSLAELRKLRLWRWDVDPVGVASARAMGLQVVTLPVAEAGHAFETGQLDGFFAVPSAALAFQWFTQARYLVDLKTSYLWGCMVVRDASFARLPVAFQQLLREGSAEVRERNEEAERQIDDALLGGVFAKNGVTVSPVSSTFRAEFFEAARRARTEVAEKLNAQKLLERVQSLLADFRAEHR
jgi:TRAP-type C4-dicarboxylate transport system substrate-binding protein